MPRQVTDAVVAHLHAEQRFGGYEAAAAHDDLLEHTYDAVATLIGAGREEIALVENATRAWDMAFYGFAFRPGDRILCARAEYSSNSLALQQVAARTGAVVEAVDDDGTGHLDVADLTRRLSAGPVALVAVTHVPTHRGLVNPAAAIGAACRAAGVPYLLDACQSAGQLPLDVRAIGCDVLVATGRKWLRGPRGTGFLYVSRDLDIPPAFLDNRAVEWRTPENYVVRADARRFESWEGNIAAKIGLGVAVDYALAVGVEAIATRVGTLADALRTRLREFPGCAVLDPSGPACGIVTFVLEQREPAEVVSTVAAAGVNINVAWAATARYDPPSVGLAPVIRASPHYYNTDEELDQLIAALPRS